MAIPRFFDDYLPLPPTEIRLYVAVLERCFRDLFARDVDQASRRQAIEWFERGKVKVNDTYITFDECIEIIPLSAPQIEFIFEKVDEVKGRKSKEQEASKAQCTDRAASNE